MNTTHKPGRTSIIFLSIYLDVFTYGMVLPLLPFFVQRYDGGGVLVGFLAASYALMQLLSGPVLGPLSDRYGRRPILLGCLAGTAVAYAILAGGDTLGFVFLAILLDGLTGGNLTAAQAYVADSTSPSERARGMGQIGAAMGLGLMTGPIFGGLLGGVNLNLTPLVGCAITIINILVTWFVLPESLPPAQRTASLDIKSLNLFSQLLNAGRMPVVRSLLFSLFILNLAFSGLQSNFPLFSQARFGWDVLQNGLFFAFVGVCGVITQGYLVGKLVPIFGETRLVITGIGVLSIMLAGMALAQEVWLLFPLVGLAAVGSGLSIPALGGLISRATTAQQQGLVMGAQQSLLSLTAIIGPILAGVLFEFVSTGAPYLAGSGIGLAGLLFAVLFFWKKPAIAAQ